MKHSSTFDSLLAWEEWSQLATDDSIHNLQQRVARNKLAFESERINSDKFIGYGSSHSTTTHIINFGLEDRLSWLVDDNPQRHGLYSPSTGLEIKSPLSLVESELPILILAWQHDWRILERVKKLRYTGMAYALLPVFQRHAFTKFPHI
jgi:hypothetical protein